MKKMVFVMAILAAILVLGSCSKVQAQSSSNWEYNHLQVEVNPNDGFPRGTLDQINNLGKEGWELVSVTAKGTRYYNLFFKRRS